MQHFTNKHSPRDLLRSRGLLCGSAARPRPGHSAVPRRCVARYATADQLVLAAGSAPATSGMWDRRSGWLSYVRVVGAGGGTRTHNTPTGRLFYRQVRGPIAQRQRNWELRNSRSLLNSTFSILHSVWWSARELNPAFAGARGPSAARLLRQTRAPSNHGQVRTDDLRLRRPVLCLAELRGCVGEVLCRSDL